MDLYNYNDLAAFGGAGNVADVLKAMEAGLQTGMQYNDQINNGGGLKVESLDAYIKVLANRLNQLVVYNEMPKQRIENTVHQYNQLYKYGEEIGIFNLEGETPEETDTQYIRKSVISKFMGVTGQVTDPAMLAKLAGGMNMYTREVQNKTTLLLTLIDTRLTDADSTCIAEQFDGIFRQHMMGVAATDRGSTEGMSTEQILDAYYGSQAVIDAQNGILTDALVEDAADRVVNVYNGYIDRIVSAPVVFNNYVKKFHESKRVVVGMSNSVVGATMGQSVNDIMTQFGKVAVKADKFFDVRRPIKASATASSSKAPGIPVANGPKSVAVIDAKTNFVLHAGSYGYLVTAKNRYGESAPLKLTDTALAVAANQSVDLQWIAPVGGAYAPTCYVVYRTKKVTALTDTTEYYPIFTIPASMLAAGYDGAAATKVRDRNRIIAGTKSALIYYNDSQINEYLQFGDTRKLDFAITAPSRRFAILNYGTPCLYQPAKICRIINIGDKGLGA
nr:MAG TPA: Major capsid protein [Herelleviridae sp.]